jgi:hypothetical protein
MSDHLNDWIDDRDERREQRLRQLGARSPRCRDCREADPFALSGVHPDVVCYECLAIEQDRSPIEATTSAGEPTPPMTSSAFPATTTEPCQPCRRSGHRERCEIPTAVHCSGQPRRSAGGLRCSR